MRTPHRTASLTAALALALFAATLLSPSAADARGKKQGFLYVNAHFSDKELEEKGKVVKPDVYVYTADGKLVHSREGKGAWATGHKIPVEPGDYLVEVGTSRSRYNLHRYTVRPGRTTVVKTGWVAVLTWKKGDQPSRGCRRWSADLKARVVADGEEHVVATNEDDRDAERGMIQLHVGTWKVYFNGLPVEVEVKEDRIHQLAMGAAGPLAVDKATLSPEKSDAPGTPRLTLCADGATHVPAGAWWLSKVVKLDAPPYERQDWTKIDVKPLDKARTVRLKADPRRGRVLAGKTSDPTALSHKEAKEVKHYADGELKATTQGRFKGTSLDSMFGDPTDVQ